MYCTGNCRTCLEHLLPLTFQWRKFDQQLTFVTVPPQSWCPEVTQPSQYLMSTGVDIRPSFYRQTITVDQNILGTGNRQSNFGRVTKRSDNYCLYLCLYRYYCRLKIIYCHRFQRSQKLCHYFLGLLISRLSAGGLWSL